MKIIFFDERKYSYNRIIHIDAISKLDGVSNLITVGNYINSKNNIKINDSNELKDIVKSVKPDCLITYNPASNNVYRFDHIKNIITDIKCVKIHISTDYCRSGFKQEQ